MSWMHITCLAIFICIFAILAGCVGTPPPQGPSLETGYNAYINGDYSGAESDGQAFIQNNPDSAYLAEAYYLIAISEEAQGRVTSASEDFQEAIAITKRPDLKAKSYKSLGDIAYSASDYASAINDYLASLAASPEQPDQWLLLRLGESLQNNGQWDQAREYLDQIITDYPGTQTATAATERLAEDHFSLQFGAYQTQAMAYGEAELLHHLRVAAIIMPANKNGQTLFMVRSGYYFTYAQALAARERLATRFPQVIVVP
jgi:tetratricopeptide (TPR) repeat protein